MEYNLVDFKADTATIGDIVMVPCPSCQQYEQVETIVPTEVKVLESCCEKKHYTIAIAIGECPVCEDRVEAIAISKLVNNTPTTVEPSIRAALMKALCN